VYAVLSPRRYSLFSPIRAALFESADERIDKYSILERFPGFLAKQEINLYTHCKRTHIYDVEAS